MRTPFTFCRIMQACTFLIFVEAAHANSDFPPWHYDGAEGRPNCAQCHFDSKPQLQSEALFIEELEQPCGTGASCELVIRLEMQEAPKAGFILSSTAGTFVSVNEQTEAKKGAIRSTREGSNATDGRAEWKVIWQQPEDIRDKIIFYLSAVAGNDDQSPLGDKVHLKTFEISTAPASP